MIKSIILILIMLLIFGITSGNDEAQEWNNKDKCDNNRALSAISPEVVIQPGVTPLLPISSEPIIPEIVYINGGTLRISL
jgi:hypothetical protein